ncbi:MAG: hypothetical protein KR126chlam5_00494, partial [Candidatus Anoxychlamydiales bacterium]|nr:hypothetical protein [Candidatus Anoxychlamydiales bacterium]
GAYKDQFIFSMLILTYHLFLLTKASISNRRIRNYFFMKLSLSQSNNSKIKENYLIIPFKKL